ncbi:hypothetical protein EROP_00850 [Erysipelotrichaceae bacterium OPF54]|uniref:hypothetical protein n=1 Tax=uncultured Dubosiella sp. TaxID=1937011 RepID=UPI00207DBEEF|nr:hypothetical protein [uncultured Dubosiella sp.]GJM56392.1 hypothetical protein EROP_00850 [Erysipelotrichaceae bacterium OPF54]
MKRSKKLLTFLAVCGLLLTVGCAGNDKKKETLKSIQLDPEADKVLVDTNTDIQITTDPKDIQLTDQQFQCSGGTIKVKGTNAEFSASEAGTYTISAKQGDVSSNTVTITVVEQESELAAADTEDVQDAAQDNSQDSSTADSSSPSSSDSSMPAAQASTPSEASPDAIDVSAVLADPDNHVGKTITIIGSLPQAAAYDSNNQPYEVIFPTSGPGNINDPQERLRLDGANVTIGSCIAELTGTLSKETVDKDQYVFDVTSFEQVSDESAQ